EADLLVLAAVQGDQEAAALGANVVDVVAEALRDVAGIAGAELLVARPAAGAEQAHADLAADYVQPFVGVRVPVRLAHRPRLQLQNDARDGPRDRELAGADAPLRTAGEA